MNKTFDGTVDGKHVEKWEPTEEEIAKIQAQLEEIKKKRESKKDK